MFDTTLREGEQMPGVVLDRRHKLELVQLLSDFGVGYIDLMPAVSKSEKEFAWELASAGLKPEITATCRLVEEEVDSVSECGIGRLTLFTPLSDILLKDVIRTSREENLSRAMGLVDYARSCGLKVDFAGVDASRAAPEYLKEFLGGLEGSIDIFFYCDSMSCDTPLKSYNTVRALKEGSKTKIGMHAHNDFGMATANTIAGVEAGAEVVSGTFIGVGPRAGNAPLEEVIIALKELTGYELGVKYEMLAEICAAMERYTGIEVQKHKPVAGELAFTHESGLHVNGILKNPKTFELYPPAEVGRERSFLFGKHSGRSGIKYALGKDIGKKELERFTAHIKERSEKEKRSFTQQEVVEMYEGFSATF